MSKKIQHKGNLAKKVSSLTGELADLLSFASAHCTTLFIAAVLSVLATAATLAQPLVVGRVIEAIQEDHSVLIPAGMLSALFVAGAMLSGLTRYLLGRAGEGVVLSLRNSLVERLLRMPVEDHERLRPGDLISRISTDTTLLRTAFVSSLTNAVSGVLMILGAIALMAYVDFVLLAVALICVAGATGVVVAVSGRIRRASEEAQRSVGSLSATLGRSLGAIRTVKLSRAETREQEAISKEAHDAYHAGVRVARLDAIVEPTISVTMQAAFVLVLGVGGWRLASEAISLGELVSFLLYLFYLVGPLSGLFASVASLQRGLGAMSRLREVLDSPVEPYGSDIPLSRSTDGGDPAESPALTFASVNFAYEPDNPILHEVSLSVPRRSLTALVGPSGAGKSTLFTLAERLREPQGGVIRLDGVDLKELPLEEVRRRIGLVEQDAPVFWGSLRENLLYSAPDATEEELEETLELANLRSLVEKLPRGLDTKVGERGVTLSGGERQRVAIARTLLAKPDVLLLDEVTSQLDAENELALRETIHKVSKTRTVFAIAHRLSTVADADRIFVLEGGNVSDWGTHEELLHQSALYRRLTESQLISDGSRASQ